MPRRVALRARMAVALTFASLLLSTMVPVVAADDGLHVTTPYPAVAVAPGDSVSFDLTVTSTRTATVALSLSGVPTDWSASLLGGGNVVEGVSVTPDEDGTVRLDVDVPATASAGSATIRVTASDGTATDVLPVRIRVDAEAAGDISLTTTTPSLTGSTDASFSFDLQFRNDTAQDVTLSVAATGEAGWDVSATLTGETQAASTVVEAGSTQGVTVAVTAPADAAAGTYPIQVEARAGERSVTADLAVEITGSYSMTLSTPDSRLSTSGSAGAPTTMTFEVTNTGTAPLTEVTVSATPPTGWDVTFDPESVPTIAPNETATVTATVTPSGEAVAGDYVVSFSASAEEDAATSTAAVRFTVETSPLWALIGLGLIVLIIGGLLYVFRTYGRR
ncbi:MAG: NEW3 domain-containing protein [Candidatus Limnocylindria bacterium]